MLGIAMFMGTIMDFTLGRAFSLLWRTLPFLLLRIVVYFGILLSYLVAVTIGGSLGYALGKVGGNSAGGSFWGAIIGFFLVSGIVYWLREYLLYLVKAGHIAVLVELMEGREIPRGRSQIEYAGSVVKQHFVESSALFALDRLIHGILRLFNRVTFNLAAILPIPGLETLMKLFNAVINTSLTYLDEAILAQTLRSRSSNPWATARDSVVLYAQNYKSILKNALVLTLVVWALTLGIFILVLGPVALLASFSAKLVGFFSFALAAIVAICLKAAFIDPFAMTALLQVYFKITQGQAPNPDWSARLSGLSDKFRQLEAKAQSAPPPAPMPTR